MSSAAPEMHLQFYEPDLDHNHGLVSKRSLLKRVSFLRRHDPHSSFEVTTLSYFSLQKEICPSFLLNLLLLLRR